MCVCVGTHHPDTLITMSYVGELYDNYNFTEEARRVWRDSLEAHIAVYGHEHVDTVRNKHHLAGLLINSLEYAEANRLLNEVLVSRRALLGNTHMDTVGARKALAESYFGLQEYAAAERPYLESLDNLREIHGDAPLQYDTLLIKGSLGLLYLSMEGEGDAGRKREYERLAFRYFNDSCNGFRELYGEQDIHYLRALGNLATYYLSTASSSTPGSGPTAAGKEPSMDINSPERRGVPVSPEKSPLVLAEGMFRTVIRGVSEILGPTHDYTIGYKSNLAMLFFNEQRNFKEAAVLFGEVLDVFVKKYGFRDVKTLTVLYPLCICYAYSGQIDVATQSAIVYCEHSRELFGESSKELQAGVAILDQLRNYRITPSRDKSPELREIYATDDGDVDINQFDSREDELPSETYDDDSNMSDRVDDSGEDGEEDGEEVTVLPETGTRK